jgi:hypothetical protein
MTCFGGVAAPFRHILHEHRDNIAGTTLDILDLASISVASAPDKQMRRWEADAPMSMEDTSPAPMMVLRQNSDMGLTASRAVQQNCLFATTAFQEAFLYRKVVVQNVASTGPSIIVY